MAIDIATSPAQLATSLAGGLLIGTATSLYLLGAQRIAGISGIFAGALSRHPPLAHLLFLAGLLLAPWLAGPAGHPLALPDAAAADWPKVVVAGLLVGFGTQLGAGCTSGHGVCGLANGSLRSLAAVVTFMAVAGLVVALGFGGLA